MVVDRLVGGPLTIVVANDERRPMNAVDRRVRFSRIRSRRDDGS